MAPSYSVRFIASFIGLCRGKFSKYGLGIMNLFLFLSRQRFSRKSVNRILLFSTCSATILSILPPLTYGKAGMLKSKSAIMGSDYNLERALKSEDYLLALYTSIIVTVPMIVEFLLDWYYSMHPSNSIFLAMWTLLASVVIPNCFLLLVICPTNSFHFIPSFAGISQFVTISGGGSLLSEYGGHVLNNSASLISFTSLFVFLVISTYAQFHSYHFQSLFMHYLRPFFLVISFGCFAINLCSWATYLYQKQERISRDDMLCSGLLVGFLVSAVLGFSFLLTNSEFNFVDRDTRYMTFFACLFMAFPLLSITMVGRMFRYDVSRLHERRAQELDQKRSFVRYISHEIRTPLNTVLMGLQLLKREVNTLPVEAAESVGAIVEDLHASCNTAVEILNEILDFDKLQAGVLQLEIEEVPVVGFVDECVASFKVQAREKNILLQLEYESGLRGERESDILEEFGKFVLRADPWKLSQVLRNLLSNAIKFTKTGGRVRVEIAMVAAEEREKRRFGMNGSRIVYSETQKAVLVITVLDTGAGISKENQSRLFKEIIQFEPGKLQEGKGSGLGLWISKQIVDLHKGSISVFSEGKGKGSVFTLKLPVERVTTPPQASNKASSDCVISSRQPLSLGLTHNLNIALTGITSRPRSEFKSEVDIQMSHRLRNLGACSARVFPESLANNPDTVAEVSPRYEFDGRALVVDDAPMNRKMLLRLLEGRYRVLESAEDGKVAVDKVEASLSEGNPYHTIFMDYQMPVMDGPTAAQVIRKMGFAGLIIGVTGNALPADVEWFLLHGANHVLPKPVNFDMLLKYFASIRQK